MLPAFLSLWVIASGMSSSMVLVLYLSLVLEGLGLLYWVISGLHVENDSVLKDSIRGSKTFVYPDRNRAEVLASFIKSGLKRPSYTEHLCKIELSKVVKRIVDEVPSISSQLSIKSNEIEYLPEFSFVLDPPDLEKIPSNSSKLDYLKCLERVVSEVEKSW